LPGSYQIRGSDRDPVIEEEKAVAQQIQVFFAADLRPGYCCVERCRRLSHQRGVCKCFRRAGLQPRKSQPSMLQINRLIEQRRCQSELQRMTTRQARLHRRSTLCVCCGMRDERQQQRTSSGTSRSKFVPSMKCACASCRCAATCHGVGTAVSLCPWKHMAAIVRHGKQRAALSCSGDMCRMRCRRGCYR